MIRSPTHFLCRSLQLYRTLSTVKNQSNFWFRQSGEGALLLRFGNQINIETNQQVLDFLHTLDNAPPLSGVREVLPAYASLLVHYDPLTVTSDQVEEWCLQANNSNNTSTQTTMQEPRTITIPVCYGGEHGPDLEIAADIANIKTSKEVADIHASGDYRVYFLGFTGGFPYMGGLPDSLTTVPRLSTPRQNVPSGAVGIAAGQTGVYTLSSPGGWHLLGRTSMTLFDPSLDPPATLQPGDRIKFVSATDENDNDNDNDNEKDNNSPSYVSNTPCLEVIAPGPMTTVQDLGRRGYGRHGVSKSGAADNISLRLGNSLVGSLSNSAGLEVAMGGLQLKCIERPVVIALTGADCGASVTRSMLPGAPPESILINHTVSLRPGDILSMGYAKDGARGYVSISNNGIDVPDVLGSKSTDIRAKMGGMGGRMLQTGDILGNGNDTKCEEEGMTSPSTSTTPMKAAYDPLFERRNIKNNNNKTTNNEWVLRMLPGPGHPETDSLPSTDVDIRSSTLDRMLQETFTVTPRADRMAVVASLGQAPKHNQETATPTARPETEKETKTTIQSPLNGGQQMSEACVSGTVQVPPDGNPVILLAEHQTTGGYTVPGIVIEADLWKVGQMRPGDNFTFIESTEQDALIALADIHRKTTEIEIKIASGSNIDMERLSGGINQLGNAYKTYGNQEHEEEGESQYGFAMSEFEKCKGLPILKERSNSKYIDLNADCGEGYDDVGLMTYVTSINVACGGHVGDPATVANTLRLASEKKITIGAHPSFVDVENFGRTALNTSPLELRDQILWQVGALQGLCSQLEGSHSEVSYIKPHGALYHAIMNGGEQGEAVYEAAKYLDLPLLLMPQSKWATFGEGFAERAYDGMLLRSRELEGAVIHDPLEAAVQACDLAKRLNLHTICVHGDSPNAVNVAKEVRRGLEEAGYVLRAFV